MSVEQAGGRVGQAELLVTLGGRYHRHKENRESLPVWLTYFLGYYEQQVVSQENKGVLAGLTDHYAAATRPVRIYGVGGVDELLALQSTLALFDSNRFGFDDAGPAFDFVREAQEWVARGVEDKLIASWFEAVLGVLCLDQPYTRMMLLSHFRNVDLLEGIYESDSKALKETTLEAIGHFAEQVSILSENETIRRAAGRLFRLVRLMKKEGHSLLLRRPEPLGPALMPLVVGIGERYQTRYPDESWLSGLAEEIADYIITRRICADETAIMSYLASFCSHDKVDLGKLIPLARTGIGKFNQLYKALYEDTEDKLQATLYYQVLPQVIQMIRAYGYSNFEWEEKQYLALGFDSEQKEKDDGHIDRVKRAKPLSVSNIPNGLFGVYVGEFDPFHIGHLLVCLTIAKMELEDFVKCGMVPDGFIGRITVGVGPNRSNPLKTRRDVTERWDLVAETLRGRNNIVMLERDVEELYGRTWERINAYGNYLNKLGKECVSFRACGLDKIPLGKYPDFEEGHSSLDKFPHVFFVDRSDITNIYAFLDRARKVLENFPRSCVVWTKLPEVHSSYMTTLGISEEEAQRLGLLIR